MGHTISVLFNSESGERWHSDPALGSEEYRHESSLSDLATSYEFGTGAVKTVESRSRGKITQR